MCIRDSATEVGQHEGLYQAYRQIADGSEYARLDAAQRKVIDNALRDRLWERWKNTRYAYAVSYTHLEVYKRQV